MNAMLQELNEHWAVVGPMLSIRNEAEYEAAMLRVDALIDEGALDRAHPLYNLLDVLGTLIHAYEEEHQPLPATTGVEVLRFLMEQHNLQLADLPEIGGEQVVSEILGGQLALDIYQRRRLANRFNVPVDVFVDRPER
jgi:HTH-type transcriptional regulator/antitoxin HigA